MIIELKLTCKHYVIQTFVKYFLMNYEKLKITVTFVRQYFTKLQRH